MRSSKATRLYRMVQVAALGMAMGLAPILAIALVLASREAAVSHATTLETHPLTEVSQSPATSITTLLVATEANYWPMNYMVDDQIVGHDIDLMDAIAAEMSVTVVYTNVLWADIFDGLIGGEYDAIISAVSVTPEREELMDFTLPYVSCPFFGDLGTIAIAVQQGDDVLRHQMNEALRQLRADGTLETIIAAIAADKPEWEPQLPEWPCVFLPMVLRDFRTVGEQQRKLPGCA